MANVRVKVEDQDDSLPYARRTTLSTSSVSITTPIRSFHLKQETTSESRLIQNDSVRGLNEIYHELTKEKIEDIDSNIEKLNEWGKKLRYIFNTPKIKNEINLLFFSYENKNRKEGTPNKVPTDQETEYLCNIVTHPSSEIIIPPFIPKISGSQYLEFLKKFFKYLKSYRKNQEIMGYIPMVATSELREINQFYSDNGIKLFTVDFSGKYPMDSYLLVNEVRRLVSFIEKEYKENGFLHAFNVPLPKAQPTTYITPAKDIMTLVGGFDSFGSYHKKESKPPDVIEKIREKIEQRKLEAKKSKTHYIPPFRLFNRQDYGYYKNDATRLEVIFKESNDNVIKLSDLSSTDYSEAKLKGLRKAFNVEEQGLEALEYRTLIKENALSKHIQKKNYGVDNLGKILRLIHYQNIL